MLLLLLGVRKILAADAIFKRAFFHSNIIRFVRGIVNNPRQCEYIISLSHFMCNISALSLLPIKIFKLSIQKEITIILSGLPQKSKPILMFSLVLSVEF